MSGTGGIELVTGVLMGCVYVTKGAFWLAGKTIEFAARTAYQAGKYVYKKYTDYQKVRLEKAKEELECVKGELKDIALARHTQLVEAEKTLKIEYESAVAERERKMDEVRLKFENADRKMEEIALELPAYFEKREEICKAYADKEITAFNNQLDNVCNKMTAEIGESIEKKKQSVLQQLDSIDTYMRAKTESYMNYVLEAKASAESLLNALKKSYDVNMYAKVELDIITSEKEKVDELLDKGDEASLKAAVGVVSTLESRALSMQVLCEQRTAKFEHGQAVLNAKCCELNKLAEATHSIVTDELDNMLDGFVTEEHNANFWSEGALGRLWKEVEDKQKAVERISYQDGQNLVLLTAEIDMLMHKLEQEHAKMRSHLLSRVILSRMAKDGIASMREIGWTLKETPSFEDDDPRKAIELVFEKEDDELVLILYDVYDEETQQFKQGIKRLRNESGIVNEQVRENEDRCFSDAMQERGYNGLNMTCDQTTAGTKKTLQSR